MNMLWDSNAYEVTPFSVRQELLIEGEIVEITDAHGNIVHGAVHWPRGVGRFQLVNLTFIVRKKLDFTEPFTIRRPGGGVYEEPWV